MINDIATTKKIAAPAHRSTFSTPTLGGVVKFNCCARVERDRKSTCLNSSHDQISYAVFCLKKKKDADCTHTFNYKIDDTPHPRTPFTHVKATHTKNVTALFSHCIPTTRAYHSSPVVELLS